VDTGTMRVRSLLSTQRRRRAVVLGLALLTCPLWATGAAAPEARSVLAALAPPPGVLAAITAGRPSGHPVARLDISSHDHERYPMDWRLELAAGTHFVYVKATAATTYVNPHFASDNASARAVPRY